MSDNGQSAEGPTTEYDGRKIALSLEPLNAFADRVQSLKAADPHNLDDFYELLEALAKQVAPTEKDIWPGTAFVLAHLPQMIVNDLTRSVIRPVLTDLVETNGGIRAALALMTMGAHIARCIDEIGSWEKLAGLSESESED